MSVYRCRNVDVLSHSTSHVAHPSAALLYVTLSRFSPGSHVDVALPFQRRFTCRSAEYSYMTLQCHLSEHDRRSVDETIEMVDADQVDYFENLCLSGENPPVSPLPLRAVRNRIPLPLRSV